MGRGAHRANAEATNGGLGEHRRTSHDNPTLRMYYACVLACVLACLLALCSKWSANRYSTNNNDHHDRQEFLALLDGSAERMF